MYIRGRQQSHAGIKSKLKEHVSDLGGFEGSLFCPDLYTQKKVEEKIVGWSNEIQQKRIRRIALRNVYMSGKVVQACSFYSIPDQLCFVSQQL